MIIKHKTQGYFNVNPDHLVRDPGIDYYFIKNRISQKTAVLCDFVLYIKESRPALLFAMEEFNDL